jgi:hypothetical protein
MTSAKTVNKPCLPTPSLDFFLFTPTRSYFPTLLLLVVLLLVCMGTAGRDDGVRRVWPRRKRHKSVSQSVRQENNGRRSLSWTKSRWRRRRRRRKKQKKKKEKKKEKKKIKTLCETTVCRSRGNQFWRHENALRAIKLIFLKCIF